jgi:oligopeptidase A
MKFAIASLLSMSYTARAFSAFLPRIVARQPQCRRLSPFTTRAMTATTGGATMTNPLLEQQDLPKFETISAENLSPAVAELLTKMEQEFSDLEKLLEESQAFEYDQVLPELEKIQFPLGFAWGVAGHLNGVKNGEELRKAYEENQPKIVQAMSKFSQSKPVYDALSAIEQKLLLEQDGALANQRRRAVEGSLRDMKLGGVGLEGEAKEKFNAYKMRLAKLSNDFSNNVLDESKSFSLTIDDAVMMEGVPESAKAMWANSHATFLKTKEAKEVEMDAENGPWRITLDIPSYIAVMSHVKDRSIREKVYKAYIQRASQANEEKNNIPLIYEILKIKTEMAKMLGFSSYAEQSLSRKMAPSVEAVSELSDLIAEKAIPAAMRELEEITTMARQQGGDDYSEETLEKLQPWDTSFWSERLKESKFELKEEETRPYFSLPAVLDGMFSLVSRIFNVEVKAADGDAEVWNPDVR